MTETPEEAQKRFAELDEQQALVKTLWKQRWSSRGQFASRKAAWQAANAKLQEILSRNSNIAPVMGQDGAAKSPVTGRHEVFLQSISSELVDDARKLWEQCPDLTDVNELGIKPRHESV